MIRLHVAKPECGRRDLSYADTSFSYVWKCSFVENIFMYLTKTGVTRILCSTGT